MNTIGSNLQKAIKVLRTDQISYNKRKINEISFKQFVKVEKMFKIFCVDMVLERLNAELHI